MLDKYAKLLLVWNWPYSDLGSLGISLGDEFLSLPHGCRSKFDLLRVGDIFRP